MCENVIDVMVRLQEVNGYDQSQSQEASLWQHFPTVPACGVFSTWECANGKLHTTGFPMYNIALKFLSPLEKQVVLS